MLFKYPPCTLWINTANILELRVERNTIPKKEFDRPKHYSTKQNKNKRTEYIVKQQKYLEIDSTSKTKIDVKAYKHPIFRKKCKKIVKERARSKNNQINLPKQKNQQYSQRNKLKHEDWLRDLWRQWKKQI